jgi:hypothetical protein
MAEEKTPEQKLFDRAMEVRDPDEARKIFADLVEISMRKHGKSYLEAESIIKENLGYMAGYYDNLTRERVERLFNCAHPFFGKISEKGPPSPEEAFRMGVELGEQLRVQHTKKNE